MGCQSLDACDSAVNKLTADLAASIAVNAIHLDNGTFDFEKPLSEAKSMIARLAPC